MNLSKDCSILSFLFRSNQKDNVSECINFIKYVLELSNAFRVEKISKGKVGKKFNKTNRVREGIDKFINREGVKPLLIKELIHLVRIGKIETIKTKIKGKDIEATATTDFTALTLEMLKFRPKG